MTKSLTDEQLYEYEFSKLLVEYINTFNLLDSNLTLCIGWFITGGKPGLAYPLVTKLSTHEKITYLKSAINSDSFKTRPDMVKDFNNWVSIASKAKCRRNNYVHGLWSIVFLGSPKNIRFEPQFWSKGSMEEFSMDEFKSIVADMRKIYNQFHDLRKKYLHEYELSRGQKQ